MRKKRMVWVYTTPGGSHVIVCLHEPDPRGHSSEEWLSPTEWQLLFRSPPPPKTDDCWYVDMHDLVDGNIEWC